MSEKLVIRNCGECGEYTHLPEPPLCADCLDDDDAAEDADVQAAIRKLTRGNDDDTAYYTLDSDVTVTMRPEDDDVTIDGAVIEKEDIPRESDE